MLGSAGGGLSKTHRRLGVALLASLIASAGAAIWTALPVEAAGQLVDADGRAVAGAEVDLAAAPFVPAAWVHTDQSGRYQIATRRWPYAAPRLTVRAPGFVPVETTGGHLMLHRWPQVTGEVVDDLGAPLAGAVVVATQRSTVLAATMSDLGGRFALMLARPTGGFTVSVAMELHDSASQDLTLGLDQHATVHANLARQLATLHVGSDPSGQAPSVDGHPAPECQATPCDITVLAGQHRVEFVTDLYLPWSQDVDLSPRGSVSVQAALVRKTGTLTVSTPFAGELTVDGGAVSGSGWSGLVPTGRHTVGFRSPSTWPTVLGVDVAWNQTVTAAPAPASITPGDANGFVAQLRAYLASVGGTYGVYLEEMSSGATMGLNDTSDMEAASVIKVPVALYLLRQFDAGLIKPDDQIDLHDEDFMGGTGSLINTAHTGDKYAYQDLLALMIQQSDNTAWRALDRVLGAGNVDGYAAGQGAGDCQQGSGMCSARSMGHLMANLARGKLLSAASTQRLLGLLESTIFNDRINYYLSGTTIAHKVGMLDDGVRNDCGVVFLQRDPFVLCMFGAGDPDTEIQAIRDVARAAAKYYGG